LKPEVPRQNIFDPRKKPKVPSFAFDEARSAANDPSFAMNERPFVAKVPFSASNKGKSESNDRSFAAEKGTFEVEVPFSVANEGKNGAKTDRSGSLKLVSQERLIARTEPVAFWRPGENADFHHRILDLDSSKHRQDAKAQARAAMTVQPENRSWGAHPPPGVAVRASRPAPSRRTVS